MSKYTGRPHRKSSRLRGVKRLHIRYLMRNSYWSESKIARRIAGYDKPYAATPGEWRVWRETTKAAYPIRYWIVEVGINKLQDTVLYIPDQLHKLFYWYNNAIVEKRHVLKTGLKRGDWYELDTRILYGLFNELVDFVEIEKAWHYVAVNDDAKKKYNPPWWRFGKFGFYLRGWRSPEAGIELSVLESKLKHDASMGAVPAQAHYGSPTSQAEAAEETLFLYTWWKNRKYRLNADDESGLTEFYDSNPPNLLNGSTWSPQQRASWRERHGRALELEQKYYDEDTQMMMRLIKIRNHLWT